MRQDHELSSADYPAGSIIFRVVFKSHNFI
jgi:hypothetical protein